MKLFAYILVLIAALLVSYCISRVDIFDLIRTPPKTDTDSDSDIGSGNEETPPELALLSAAATAHDSVRVSFSNDLEQTNAETKTNYSIPGLDIVTVSQNQENHAVVEIITSYHEDINYKLIVRRGVKDIYDNSIGAQNSKNFKGDVAPYIRSVSSYSNKEVVIYFSEAVTNASAEDKKNYSISDLIVTSAKRDKFDYSIVKLQTSSQLDGVNYSIDIHDVEDLTGNGIIRPSTKDFVGNGFVDKTAPSLVFAQLIDNKSVEIQFSEPMDGFSTSDPNNYTINDNTGETIMVNFAIMQSDKSKVVLHVDGIFSKSLYTLFVSTRIKDESNNELKGPPYNTIAFAGMGPPPESFTDGPVIVDPMGEGSNSFSMLAKYKGRIYIGPSGTDDAIFRLKPDGSNPEIVSFIFHGNGANTATLNPGPDGEKGINYICGGKIGGIEYLFIGPFKTEDYSEIDYIYYTTDNGNTIEFGSLYVSDYLGLYTKSVSSMILFNDNLYVGLPNRDLVMGRKKPYFIKLQSINPLIGIDLEGYSMPRIGYYGGNEGWKVGIDFMAIYDDKLYIANGGDEVIDGNGGILRSTNGNPDSYGISPSDWEDVTPVQEIDWYGPTNDRFSIELQKIQRLIPADKAFPCMVEFNGKLYVARNTTDGPQLWKHDGLRWALVATYGAGLTTMNNPDNNSISLLVVNDNRLYIGYDNNIDGIQIWRTADGIIDPSYEGDFEPVSTEGLGDPENNQRIYHGLSIADRGIDYLWLLCGKESGSIRVYRASN